MSSLTTKYTLCCLTNKPHLEAFFQDIWFQQKREWFNALNLSPLRNIIIWRVGYLQTTKRKHLLTCIILTAAFVKISFDGCETLIFALKRVLQGLSIHKMSHHVHWFITCQKPWDTKLDLQHSPSSSSSEPHSSLK